MKNNILIDDRQSISGRRSGMSIFLKNITLLCVCTSSFIYQHSYAMTCNETISAGGNCAGSNTTVKQVKECVNDAPNLVDTYCAAEIELRDTHDELEEDLKEQIEQKYRDFYDNDPEFRENVVDRNEDLSFIQSTLDRYIPRLESNITAKADFARSVKNDYKPSYDDLELCARSIATSIEISNNVEALSRLIADLQKLKSLELQEANNRLTELYHLQSAGENITTQMSASLATRGGVFDQEGFTIDYSAFTISGILNKVEEYIVKRKGYTDKILSNVIDNGDVKFKVITANQTGAWDQSAQDNIVNSQKLHYQYLVNESLDDSKSTTATHNKTSSLSSVYTPAFKRFKEAQETLKVVELCELSDSSLWDELVCSDAWSNKQAMTDLLSGGLESEMRESLALMLSEGEISLSDYDGVISSLDSNKLKIAAMYYDSLLNNLSPSSI